MQNIEKFQIHYYLDNDSHSMDAYVRNKCESELLAVLLEVCTILDFQISVETVAFEEGGLKEFWKLLGENKDQIAVLITLMTLVLSGATLVSSRFPPTDLGKEDREKQIQELTIEEKRLIIEERKISIEKIKLEVKNKLPTDSTLQKAAGAIEDSLKIQTRRSNFFKNLSNYQNVNAVSFLPFDYENKPTLQEKIIKRIDFNSFVLSSSVLPVETVDDAVIEIVAPVLKEGNFKWKGVYDKNTISFVMSDVEFKASVLREEVSFQHGSCITCVLQINKKLDELGEVVVAGYAVSTVIEKSEGSVVSETAQGKKHRAHKKFIENQHTLFPS